MSCVLALDATALPLRRRQRRVTRPPAAQGLLPSRDGPQDQVDPEA